MKKVLNYKRYTSVRTGDVHVTEGSNIDPEHGTLETGGS